MKLLYVAGLAHSGSTYFSKILNQHSDIFSAGELIDIHEMANEKLNCACLLGTDRERCPFWGSVWDRLADHDVDLPSTARLDLDRRKEWVHSLLSHFSRNSRNQKFGEQNRRLLEVLSEESKSDVIVDCSKTLWRLLPLQQHLGDDLYVIHLMRSPGNQIASKVNRGSPFWRSALMKYGRKNPLYRYFGRDSKHFRTVTMKNFAEQPKQHLREIFRWLELDWEPVFELPPQPFHHLQGDTPARTRSQLKRPDPGKLEKDPAFSPVQRWTVNLLHACVYRPLDPHHH